MRTTATREEVALLRLAAQRVVDADLDDPAAVVRWLAAVQGQDLPGALTSVALRTPSRSTEDVRRALDDGHVVRSWPMRGTLHLVAAEDLGWMLALTGDRQHAAARHRHRDLGLDDADLARSEELARELLADGAGLARRPLLDALTGRGLDAAGGRGSHLLGHLARRGVVCYGPLQGRTQLLVLVDGWVREPRRLTRDEALREWALRYFRSHGPATDRDLARWTGLPLGACRTGLAACRDQLDAVDVDGVEHWMDPATPDRLAEHREEAGGLHLLPGFDEVVLGYADRSATLPLEHAERVVPGGNGVFRGTVLARGRAVGTWSRPPQGRARPVTAEPFAAFPAGVVEALPAATARLPD